MEGTILGYHDTGNGCASKIWIAKMSHRLIIYSVARIKVTLFIWVWFSNTYVNKFIDFTSTIALQIEELTVSFLSCFDLGKYTWTINQ